MKKVTVIGAGILGMSTASYLRRDGHDVTVLTMHPPGEYCSFGNAGMLNNAGCVPQAMPGVVWKVPGYLTDPLGPLVVRGKYLFRALPWLLRFLANANRRQAEHASKAIYSMVRDTVPTYEELARWAGVPELIRRSNYLVAYDTEKAYQDDALAWKLRAERGVKTEILDAAGIRRLVPQLSPHYVVGVHVLDQAFVRNPERLVKSLAAKFQQEGGVILQRKVLGIETGGGGVKALHTDAVDIPVEK